MNRREFMASAGVATSAAALGGAATSTAAEAAPATGRSNTFNLKYAPHFGMFRNSAGNDLVDQFSFAADEGFTAWEDNGMANKPVDVQERLAGAMDRLGITMGVFVASAHWGEKTFVRRSDDIRAKLTGNMRAAVEVAKRVNATWCTVLLDAIDPGLEWDYQTANAIENLKFCAEVCEPHGLVMVLEPLNPWANHPGLFLTKIPQAYQICQAVGSPSCKILNDLYHQQITEGNLIPNIDRAWDEIAYYQMGDNPGRREPTTGEINYLNVFKHIHQRGFTGVLGMEHGNSRPGKEGERAVIDAYRACDSF